MKTKNDEIKKRKTKLEYPFNRPETKKNNNYTGSTINLHIITAKYLINTCK